MADKRVLDPCCGRDVREKLVELVGTALDGTLLNITDSVVDCVVDALIAHGVTAQEWISVKDERKPKQLQECLCVCQFDDDAKVEWRFFNVLKWYDVPYQDNGIVNRPHFTDEGVHGMVVTHWMSLPKLPQPPKGE